MNSPTAPAVHVDAAPMVASWRLALLASLSLFLELALIRFAAANVLYLGYFGNLVLVSAFLGVGVGFLLEKRSFALFRIVPELLLAILAFLVFAHIDASILRRTSGQIFFGIQARDSWFVLWGVLPLLFVSVGVLFACIAQETARAFRGRKPLAAYSVDVVGSMLGILGFTVLGWQSTPPMVWFVLAYLALVALATRTSDRVRTLVVGALAIGLLAHARPQHYSRWSPYQHIEVWPLDARAGDASGFNLAANGVGHQTMQRVGTKEPIYDFPYQLATHVRSRPYQRALIIGAGSGTDVSYALANGIQQVDAVEIDPEILAAGRAMHPEHPYSDPRVTVHNDDGRAFLQRPHDKYDLIIFALPDSLASLSSLSNVRLESYLFTKEAITRAAGLLADDGIIVLYNYYRKDWLVERLADTVEAAVGHAPVIARWGDERGGALAAIAAGPSTGGAPRSRAPSTLATDDWPFLYMQSPHIPGLYFATMAAFVVLAGLAVAATGNLRAQTLRTHGPFILMGAAFLLLESKSVVHFSLLFGATWIVNSMVFFAVLASVLLANIVASRLGDTSPLVPFALLTVALAAGIFVEPSALLAIASPALRYVAASSLWFAPIFCANVAFARLFRDAEHAPAAFGLNVVGTALGGALEYLSLALGYQLLAIVVTLLYAVAALWAVRIARRAPVAS